MGHKWAKKIYKKYRYQAPRLHQLVSRALDTSPKFGSLEQPQGSLVEIGVLALCLKPAAPQDMETPHPETQVEKPDTFNALTKPRHPKQHTFSKPPLISP